MHNNYIIYKECSSCHYYKNKDINAPCERCNMADMYMEEVQGLKFSKDKVDWTLLPWAEVQEVVDVLDFGAKKYSRDNWKKVPRKEYEKALMRHIISYVTGEEKDVESQKSHLAHAICNCLFLMWMDKDA